MLPLCGPPTDLKNTLYFKLRNSQPTSAVVQTAMKAKQVDLPCFSVSRFDPESEGQGEIAVPSYPVLGTTQSALRFDGRAL